MTKEEILVIIEKNEATVCKVDEKIIYTFKDSSIVINALITDEHISSILVYENDILTDIGLNSTDIFIILYKKELSLNVDLQNVIVTDEDDITPITVLLEVLKISNNVIYNLENNNIIDTKCIHKYYELYSKLSFIVNRDGASCSNIVIGTLVNTITEGFELNNNVLMEDYTNWMVSCGVMDMEMFYEYSIGFYRTIMDYILNNIMAIRINVSEEIVVDIDKICTVTYK